MRGMVIVKANKDSEAGKLPSAENLNAMGKFNEELVNAGIMLAGDGLHPSSRAKRVRITAKGRTVIDGPFAETKELVAGFWIWQVKSMDEAMAWANRIPNPTFKDEECEVEIRPIFEMADFEASLTPEIKERDERLRGKLSVPQG